MNALLINTDFTSLLDTIANLLTVVVAVIAIIVTFVLDARTKKREMEVAAAHVKPLLAIETEEFEDHKSVKLVNHGHGTAVMTHILIAKHGKADPINRLANLMYTSRETELMWNQSIYFTPGQTQYLDAGKSLDLVLLTEEFLEGENLSTEEIEQVLADWKKELSGISIEIVYEDVLRNEQKDPCKRKF